MDAQTLYEITKRGIRWKGALKSSQKVFEVAARLRENEELKFLSTFDEHVIAYIDLMKYLTCLEHFKNSAKQINI